MGESFASEQTIAVVGGTGYLGRHISALLFKQGAKFWIVGRSPTAPPEQRNFEYRSLQTGLTQAISGASTVIHLATLTTPAIAESDPGLDLQNVRLTIDLSNACAAVGVRHLIFASSGGTVYGNTEGTVATEVTYPKCSCTYAISKLASENFIRLAAEKGGPRSTVLRVSNPYGGTQQVRGGQGVVSYIAKQIKEGREVALLGNTIRDYIHVDDVARCFLAAMNRDNQENQIYNVSSGRGVSLSDLCGSLFEHFGVRPNVRMLSPRPFDLPYNVLNNEKARNFLGWTPSVSLAAGLGRYVESLKKSDSP
jgi:UDP-glucose 4-epimerase